jgi:hypothetical protein
LKKELAEHQPMSVMDLSKYGPITEREWLLLNLSDEKITSTLLQSEWLRFCVMYFSVTGNAVAFQ